MKQALICFLLGWIYAISKEVKTSVLCISSWVIYFEWEVGLSKN
jgi:hypothetical protein